MNQALTTRHEVVYRTSDELLVELQAYGRPRVLLMADGWHAAIELNTTAEGASGTVRSDFDHPKPSVALTVLLDRVQAATGRAS